MHIRTRTTHRNGPAPGRTLLALTSLGAVVALAACSSGTGGDGDAEPGDGTVELRMTWWGSDARHTATQQAIELFEEANPGITVVPEFSDWDGYWDKLATATAGGDTPDVLQMDGAYLATYADQGTLADLRELDGFDAGGIDEAALASGELDGGLYGVVNAVNSWSVVANRTLVEEAGLELPDDSTWTWADLTEFANAFSAAAPDGVYGLQDWGLTQGTLDQWARQHGETLWTDDGGFGVSEETLVAYWEMALGLIEDGGLPPATVQAEQQAATQDQSLGATNRAALGFWWSNQLSALAAASGQELVLLRPPLDDDGERGIWYRPSQFWSVAATSEHPEEAALLVDFLVNSPEAGEVLLAERGTPGNVEVREAIRDLLSPEDQTIATYLDDIADELDGVAALAPAGSSDFEATLIRATSQVYFGQATPEQAAQTLIAEVEAMLG